MADSNFLGQNWPRTGAVYTPPVTAPVNFKGAWSADSSYAVGDIVTNSGRVWLAASSVAAGSTSPTFRGLTSVEYANVGASLAPHANTQVGDLQVLTIGGYDQMAAPATLAGWTTVAIQAVSYPRIVMYSRVAPDLTAVSLPTDSNGAMVGATLRAYAPGTILGTPIKGSGASTPSITSLTDHLVSFALWQTSGSGNVTLSPVSEASTRTPTTKGITEVSGVARSVAGAVPAVTVSHVFGNQSGYVEQYLAVPISTGATAGTFSPGTSWNQVGVVPSRTTATYTTASLAAQGSETGNIQLSVGYRLYKIVSSRPARVRVYATTAHRTADAARLMGVDPVGDHGVILEFAAQSALLSAVLSPFVDGASMESSPVNQIPISIQNLDSAAGTVAVTLTWLGTE